MSKGHHDGEDDAMFSKKPLGGLSCASCEKDLINMHGKRVEFMPWNKLPFRDPSERIARVGQGFSKMLSMINPATLSGYQQSNSAMNAAAEQPPIETNYNEPYRAMARKTQNNFPKTDNHFVTTDGKRPGSATMKHKNLP